MASCRSFSAFNVDNAIKVLCAPAEKDGSNTLAGLLRVSACGIKSCISSGSRPCLANFGNHSHSAVQSTARAPKAERLGSHVPSTEILAAASRTAKCGDSQRQSDVLLQRHPPAHRDRRLQSRRTIASPVWFRARGRQRLASSDRSRTVSTR
jgi:hypothetical protein